MTELAIQSLANYLEQFIEYAVLGLEIIIAIAIIVIVAITLISVFRASLSNLRNNQAKQQRPKNIYEIISRMSRGLLFTLDFLVAAEILKSILVPTLPELGQLAVVVIVRILLSWSLTKELTEWRNSTSN